MRNFDQSCLIKLGLGMGETGDYKAMENEEKKYLGVDYGKAKVGLAISDSETRIAFCYGVLKNGEKFLQSIFEIIRKEGIKKVVIGIPVHPDAKEAREKIESLGRSIKNLQGVEVEYQNEMFSTKEALINLAEKGGRNIGKNDDSEAARIILQSWLDRRLSRSNK